MNPAQTVNSTDLRRTDLRVDDADIDDAIADAAKTQTIIDETIQAGNIPIPAVLDPASVNIMKELLDISMSGASDDVKEAKLAEIADRVDEAQMPQLMLCLSKINETSKMLLAKEKENRKRAREESAAGGESYTSPKKQNPLRLTATMTGGAFAPPAPVRPVGVMQVAFYPQELAETPVMPPRPVAVPVVEQADPAADSDV